MRTLAIDLGTRRVGLAMSDEGAHWATPLDVLFVTDAVQAIEPIIKIIKTEAVRKVVVGFPLNMDDTAGPASRVTLRWARQLSAAMSGLQSVPQLVFVDERLSSFAAEQQLSDRKRAGEKLTQKRKKQQLDAVAAAGFLQAYLDGKLEEIAVGGTMSDE